MAQVITCKCLWQAILPAVVSHRPGLPHKHKKTVTLQWPSKMEEMSKRKPCLEHHQTNMSQQHKLNLSTQPGKLKLLFNRLSVWEI